VRLSFRSRMLFDLVGRKAYKKGKSAKNATAGHACGFPPPLHPCIPLRDRLVSAAGEHPHEHPRGRTLASRPRGWYLYLR